MKHSAYGKRPPIFLNVGQAAAKGDTMTKRVLFLGNDTTYFLTHRLPLAKSALAAGYEVHVATPPADGIEIIRSHGLTYHPLQMSRWGGRPLQELRSLLSIYRLFRNLKPDLVHKVTIKPVIYGGLMARLTGVPAVISSVSGLGFIFLAQGFFAGIVREGVRVAYRLALAHPRSLVIFQNPDDREEFIKRGLVAADKTVIIKGSGVDVDLFTVTPEPQSAVTVIFPSRMLRDKGIEEFVEAAGMIRAKGVNARFALVGDTEPGNPASVPVSQLQNWHESGVVEWWGYRENMPHVLAQSHIVCLPSYREGVPKALIEAAACGRPIVTTDVPGCREIVRHGYNGLLVPARDSLSLMKALHTLILDPSLRKDFGAHGREMAVCEFSVDRVIRETLALYRDLLQ